ncbi:hypothetical protein NTGM5_150028 [Candidatus Nitrotoga sp. M5]|nr:hypothetical protein NTGM5_150028 [Candidatus Nitrotoga sp. M5]
MVTNIHTIYMDSTVISRVHGMRFGSFEVNTLTIVVIATMYAKGMEVAKPQASRWGFM